ncbi:hypothetical protein ABT096_15720 [Streptomyces sp. NPDC002561]|uniref:hypothetical protein n=1 Tax=Streptomyces sp. NPDC002561 TaxID=3154418 RepID=UPI003333071C
MNLTRAARVRISVSDLDASVAFYEALTGREPVASGATHGVPFGGVQGLSTADLRCAAINLDNGLGIDLIGFRNPSGEPTGAPPTVRARCACACGWTTSTRCTGG